MSGFFEQGPSYRTTRRKGAGNWLLIVTVGGTGRFRQPGLDLLVETGDAVLLEPRAYSDYGTASSSWSLHWVHFVPPAAWDRWLHFEEVGKGVRLARLATKSARKRIVQAFQRLHADMVRGGLGVDELAMAAVQEILVVINRECGVAPITDSRIATALEQLQADLAAPHTVEALAKTAGLSPSRFAHRFREEVGDSVVQTLNKLRIRQAMRLLACTDEPVGAIGESVGFTSPHYFSRIFAAMVGQSPMAYRREHRRD